MFSTMLNVASNVNKLDSKIDKVALNLVNLERNQKATMKILKDIIQDAKHAPKMMLFLPETRSVFKNMSVSNWFVNKVKVVFVCPITMEVPKKEDGTSCGYIIKLPSKWVIKYGPALLMTLRMLKLASDAAKIFIPIPDEIKNTINTANETLDKFRGSGYGTLYDFLMKQKELKAVSKYISQEGDNLTDISGLLQSALENSGVENQGAKQISELFDPPDETFTKSGLVPATDMNGVTHYVKKEIKLLYEEFGYEICLKMEMPEIEEERKELLEKKSQDEIAHKKLFEKRIQENLNSSGTRILNEGYLEKKGLGNPLSLFQKRYFVLKNDGTLVYYESKDDCDKFFKHDAGQKSKTGLLEIQKGSGSNDMIFIFKNPKENENDIKQTFRTTDYEDREKWITRARRLRTLA
mmetsp:Transcript_23445/g.35582  ORF Transcript_23445/g.35582 Transcript_23445/m.35582 type:complete len:409 (-) Transcript_23445:125-1351(-)